MSQSIFERDFNTVDNTGPLAPLGPGVTVAVPVGVDTVLLPAAPGRVKAYVLNAGGGRMWIGLDGPAVVGHGIYMDAGGVLEEFLACAIHGIAETTDVTATAQELGA